MIAFMEIWYEMIAFMEIWYEMVTFRWNLLWNYDF